MTWAARHEVPVRFCDLPASAVLALREADADSPDASGPPDAASHEDDEGEGDAGEEEPGVPPGVEERLLSLDPIGEMAAAAGYDDPERWWDDLGGARVDGRGP